MYRTNRKTIKSLLENAAKPLTEINALEQTFKSITKELSCVKLSGLVFLFYLKNEYKGQILSNQLKERHKLIKNNGRTIPKNYYL